MSYLILQRLLINSIILTGHTKQKLFTRVSIFEGRIELKKYELLAKY